MASRFDMDIEALRAYRPSVVEPDDFDAFWSTTTAASRLQAVAPTVCEVDSPLRAMAVHDLEFSGYGGERIKAWILTPVASQGPLPTIVEFVGYGGSRGLPHERLGWSAAGFTHVVMDTRGQGGGWGTGGSTWDHHGSDSSVPGFLTRGITDPKDFYYRRVHTDAVLLIDAVRQLEQVDARRIAVTGTSQGGGIALAVAGLVDDLIAVMPDVPFLCHLERAIGLTDALPYQEVVQYLSVHRDRVEDVFRTLSYFDGVTFARRATAPALFSVALMDHVCPPSTVFAAANQYLGGAEVTVYPFNGHEGGLGVQWARQVAWLTQLLNRS